MELKEIIAQAELAEALQAEIAVDAAVIKTKAATLRGLLVETIPSMFIENGLQDITLTSGAKVGLKMIFAVSMPAPGTVAGAKPERRKELSKRVTACINWIKKHKGAALVKHVVTVQFDAGTEGEARALFAELRKRKLNPSGSKSVNANSLKAFLKEKWMADVEIPVELFETYTGQEAEIYLPKTVTAKTVNTGTKRRGMIKT